MPTTAPPPPCPAGAFPAPAAAFRGACAPPRSWTQRLMLGWVGAVVWRVYRGILRDEDWPPLNPDLSSGAIARRTLELWAEEEQVEGTKDSRGRKQPSVRRLLWRLTGGRLLAGLLLAALRGVLEQGVLPLLVREVLLAIGRGERDGAQVVLLASYIVLCRLGEAAAESLAFNLVLEHSWLCTAAASSTLVLRKADVALGCAPQARDLGPQVLLVVDLPRLQGRIPMTVFAAASVGGLVAGIATMFYLLGALPAALGLVWVLFLIAIATKARSMQTTVERPMCSVTAARMHAFATLLNTIKGVKLFAWEGRYCRVISEYRRRELRHILRFNSWWFVGSTIGKCVPITTPLITFATFVLLGGNLDIAFVFTVNTIFIQFRRNVDTLAIGVGIVKTLDLTLERIQRYMDVPERAPRPTLQRGPVDAGDPIGGPLAVLPPGRILHADREDDACRAASGAPPGAAGAAGFALDVGAGVEVRPGELVAVCGGVGQGKSTLMRALVGALGDGCRLEGAVAGAACVAGADVAYVPQRAFVLSGTIRENLVMGAQESEHLNERLAEAMAAAALTTDVEALPFGLCEEVGERGTTLSGGQQARLNLARALVREPSLLVTDDVLAAVDAKVALRLFRSIRRFLAAAPARRAVVMAINQSYLLENFDRVIFVHGGQVAGQGRCAALRRACPAFAEFVAGVDPVVVDAGDKTLRDEELVARCRALVARGAELAASVSCRGHLLRSETTHVGQEASMQVWLRYARIAGVAVAAAMVISEVLTFACMAVRDWWLVVWAASEIATEEEDNHGFYIGFYALLCVLQLGFHIAAAVFAVAGCLRASSALHFLCLQRLLRAPVGYFEETPQGRLLSRFGTDLSQLDTQISVYLESAVQIVFMLFMFATVVSINLPWMIPVFVLSAIWFWIPCKAGFQARIASKRCANAALGPLCSNLAELEAGFPLVRAMGLHAFFFHRHCAFQDEQARFNTIGMATMNFGRLAVDVGNVLLTAVVAASLVAAGVAPGDAGPALSYTVAFGMFILIQNMVFSQLFTWGANVERMLDVIEGDIPEEALAPITGEDGAGPGGEGGKAADPLLTGPGAIEFEDVSLRYRAGLPLALEGLSLRIAPGSRVGVVGRTGAGKSTLIVCLFRLVDRPLLEGRVLLDGLDTAAVELFALRRAMSMIPQDPVLMDGSVRFNLDPFGEFADEALQEALGRARLPGLALRSAVAEGTLSAGEKQLLCFARALLLRRRVLVADEPTASVDMRTDALVQSLLRDAFEGSTVLTVAHRLQTILDYDRIIVMDGGRCAEDGSPSELLRRPGSLFAQYHAAGRGEGEPAKYGNGECKLVKMAL